MSWWAAGALLALILFVWIGWAVRDYRRLVHLRDTLPDTPELGPPFILPEDPDEHGIVKWDWQFLLVLVGVLIFIAVASAVIW
jgi:hypothetical protein